MTATRNGNEMKISVKTDKAYSVRLVNVVASSVSAGEMKIEDKDTVITLSGNADFTITL